MNRTDLQKLSDTRVREARALYKAGEYSGAYYLAGYAVECALKSCIAKGVQRFDFPDKDRVLKSYSHKLSDLATLARLDSDLSVAAEDNSRLGASWDLVKNWSEQSRYTIWTRNDAEAIINAIVRRNDGVLPWIKRRW